MVYNKQHKKSEGGFALLLALVVVSVVVSIGLTILDLSMKQVRLSTNSKESEIAFHAANAGLECARYWRQKEAVNIEYGDNFDVSCFGVTERTEYKHASYSGFDAHFYEVEMTWGAPAERCSQMKILAITSDESSTTTVTNMETLIPSYPYGNNKDCEPGGRCTVISVQGYSKGCTSTSTIGTVQREVLLEL